MNGSKSEPRSPWPLMLSPAQNARPRPWRHDTSDVWIDIGSCQRVLDFVEHFVRECIQPFRAVERQPKDTRLGSLYIYVLIGSELSTCFSHRDRSFRSLGVALRERELGQSESVPERDKAGLDWSAYPNVFLEFWSIDIGTLHQVR